jgi:hypothetical protein
VRRRRWGIRVLRENDEQELWGGWSLIDIKRNYYIDLSF